VRKPSEPREKEATGGTTRWKSQLLYRTVPSPPNYHRLITGQGLWGSLGGYGNNKVEEVGLTETDFRGPEFDFLGGMGEFFLQTIVVEGRGSLEIGIHVSPISLGRGVEGGT
jgi:hypothetical protein